MLLSLARASSKSWFCNFAENELVLLVSVSALLVLIVCFGFRQKLILYQSALSISAETFSVDHSFKVIYCAALSYLDTPLKAAKVAKEKLSVDSLGGHKGTAKASLLATLPSSSSLLFLWQQNNLPRCAMQRPTAAFSWIFMGCSVMPLSNLALD